jgi:acetylornithine deacetylase
MSELADLLSRLVAIDSVNPDLVLGGAGEGEIAAFVADWLSEAGLEVVLQETAPGRPNVVAAVRGAGGGRSLMLNAHLDTVGYAGMERPLAPSVEGNRLYGRGAFDMKGSLAAIMLAAAELAKDPPRGHVLITAVTDEEYASIGTQAIAGAWRADAAIVTEPTGLDVCVAHKGFVWLDVETRGVAAHGSRPDLGLDAIAKMGKILVGIEQLDRALRAAPTHPLLSSGSIHASLIEGGIELSTYPDRCRLQVERRTIPGETVDLVERQITGLIDGIAASDPDVKATVTRGLAREPFEVGADEPIVQILRRHAAKVTGRDPAVIGETGWMDSALLSAAGIPTVIFGPDGDGAHAAVEWVDLDHVEQCRQIYLAVAREFCA